MTKETVKELSKKPIYARSEFQRLHWDTVSKGLRIGKDVLLENSGIIDRTYFELYHAFANELANQGVLKPSKTYTQYFLKHGKKGLKAYLHREVGKIVGGSVLRRVIKENEDRRGTVLGEN